MACLRTIEEENGIWAGVLVALRRLEEENHPNAGTIAVVRTSFATGR